jgi:DNA-binding MarR family transcriptional regulator
MSNEPRDALIADCVDRVRAFQNAVDGLDQAASEALGLNRTDLRCLDLLNLHGPMTAGQLAEQSGMSTGATTAVIDRLERSGFVQRHRDETDRRRVYIHVTDKLFQLAGPIYGPLGEEGLAQLARYSDEELKLIGDFLRQGAELNLRHARRIREQMAQA